MQLTKIEATAAAELAAVLGSVLVVVVDVTDVPDGDDDSAEEAR